MAFDLLSYISQQVGQHHTGLLADEDKNAKQRYVTHLIALQFHQLIQIVKNEAHNAYQIIQQQDVMWLSQKTSQHIQQETLATQFFQPIHSKVAAANEKIAATILQELLQLDQTAQLGISGIKELLEGQYSWMQNDVEAWFWDSVRLPEYKVVEETQHNDEADFNQVMKEFSQMIQQQAAHTANTSAKVQTEQEMNIQHIGTFYRVLNPVIALAIIIGLFNIIL